MFFIDLSHLPSRNPIFVLLPSLNLSSKIQVLELLFRTLLEMPKNSFFLFIHLRIFCSSFFVHRYLSIKYAT